jgi:hypothetical protein
MRKKLLLSAGIVIVLCVIGASIYLGMMLLSRNGANTSGSKSDQAKLTPVIVCRDDIINTASSAIGENNLASLSAVSAQVMTIGQYKNDANCEYIIARYYLASGQADKASDAIDQLQRVLSAGGEYSTLFNPPAVNVSDLRSALNTLRTQQKAGSQQIPGDDLNKVDNQK